MIPNAFVEKPQTPMSPGWTCAGARHAVVVRTATTSRERALTSVTPRCRRIDAAATRAGGWRHPTPYPGRRGDARVRSAAGIMEFPVWIPIGPWKIHPHALFEALAYAVAFRMLFVLRRRQGDTLPESSRLVTLAAAAV